MAGMHAEIEIQRPVGQVFDYFTHMENTIVGTDQAVESVAKATPEPFGPGTRYVIRQPVFGRSREQTMTVLDVEPDHRLEMEAAFGPVRPRFRLGFESTAHGTRVTFDGDSHPVGPFRLVPFLMNWIGQRNWRRRLRLIKAVLEAEAKPAAEESAGPPE